MPLRRAAYVAVRYKACVGFCQVFAWLLLEQGDQELAGMGTGTEFLTWMEAGEWLRDSRQVCAGSGHQIATLFEAFCRGEGPALGSSPVLEVVGLQAALALATYEGLADEPADGGLGCRLLAEGRAPWLFAVTSRPGAPASSVLRFFPRERAGSGLLRFLATEASGHAERERLFWDCALQVGGGMRRGLGGTRRDVAFEGVVVGLAGRSSGVHDGRWDLCREWDSHFSWRGGVLDGGFGLLSAHRYGHQRGLSSHA